MLASNEITKLNATTYFNIQHTCCMRVHVSAVYSLALSHAIFFHFVFLFFFGFRCLKNLHDDDGNNDDDNDAI